MKLPNRAPIRICSALQKFFQLLACLFLAGLMQSVAIAASVGPDDYGYVATDVPYAFENISATGTNVLVGSDDGTIAVPVGFSFSFYGASYTNISFSPNGLITFGGKNGQFGNVDLTTTAPGGDLPSVAVLWDDWQALPGSVVYQTLGTPGTRRLIVQWNDIQDCCSGIVPETVTFQAVLYEATGVLKFQYADVTSIISFGGSATVGIRDTGGNVNGRVLQWSVDSPVIANGQAIQFRPGHRIGLTPTATPRVTIRPTRLKTSPAPAPQCWPAMMMAQPPCPSVSRSTSTARITPPRACR